MPKLIIDKKLKLYAYCNTITYYNTINMSNNMLNNYSDYLKYVEAEMNLFDTLNNNCNDNLCNISNHISNHISNIPNISYSDQSTPIPEYHTSCGTNGCI